MKCISKITNLLKLLFVMFGISLPINVLAIESDLYAAFGFKQVSWYSSKSTSAIQLDENLHHQLDFTLEVADNWVAGLLLDLDSDVEENRKIAVQLGFGKWGLFIDTGNITGKFSEDNFLAFNPPSGKFAYEYKYVAAYKLSRNRRSQSGVGYATWKLPSRAVVNYGVLDELNFIDPETRYETIGYFLRVDKLRSTVEGYGRAGFDMEVSMLIGITSLKPSSTEVAKIQSITGQPPSASNTNGIGGINTFRFGYFIGKRVDHLRTFGWGFSAGYEIQQYGFILPFSDSTSDKHKIFSDANGISHGVFAKFGAAW